MINPVAPFFAELRDCTPSFNGGHLNCLCIGDSCTFGHGCALEHTWPSRLEFFLRTGVKATKIRTHNFGVKANNALDSILLYDSFLRDVPHDILVWQICHNDAAFHSYCPPSLNYREFIDSTWDKKSFHYTYLKKAFSILHGAKKDIPIVIFYLKIGNDKGLYADIIKKLCDKFGFLYVDTVNTIDCTPLKNRCIGPEDAHPSNLVYNSIAKTLSNCIKRNALLPFPKPAADKPAIMDGNVVSSRAYAIMQEVCRHRDFFYQDIIQLQKHMLAAASGYFSNEIVRFWTGVWTVDTCSPRYTKHFLMARSERILTLAKEIILHMGDNGAMCAWIVMGIKAIRRSIDIVPESNETGCVMLLRHVAMRLLGKIEVLLHQMHKICERISHLSMENPVFEIETTGNEPFSDQRHIHLQISCCETEGKIFNLSYTVPAGAARKRFGIPGFHKAIIRLTYTNMGDNGISKLAVSNDNQSVFEKVSLPRIPNHEYYVNLDLEDRGLRPPFPIPGSIKDRAARVVFYPATPATMTLITITYDTTGLNIIAVVDQNPGEAFFCGHPVIGFKDLLTLDFDFIAVSEADDYDKARAMFIEIGFEESKDFFLV